MSYTQECKLVLLLINSKLVWITVANRQPPTSFAHRFLSC